MIDSHVICPVSLGPVYYNFLLLIDIREGHICDNKLFRNTQIKSNYTE